MFLYVSLTNTAPLTEGVDHKELHPQMAGSLGAVKGTQKKESVMSVV